MKQQKPETSRDVVCFELPFRYSFDAGTPDSVRFLDFFSYARVDEFVLSQWKQVVFHKWRRQRAFHIVTAILYWIFTVIVTLSLIFHRGVPELTFASLGFIAYFTALEVVELVAYMCFAPKK